MPTHRKRKKKRPKTKPVIPQWKLDQAANRKELAAWHRARKTEDGVTDNERPFWAT